MFQWPRKQRHWEIENSMQCVQILSIHYILCESISLIWPLPMLPAIILAHNRTHCNPQAIHLTWQIKSQTFSNSEDQIRERNKEERPVIGGSGEIAAGEDLGGVDMALLVVHRAPIVALYRPRIRRHWPVIVRYQIQPRRRPRWKEIAVLGRHPHPRHRSPRSLLRNASTTKRESLWNPKR